MPPQVQAGSIETVVGRGLKVEEDPSALEVDGEDLRILSESCHTLRVNGRSEKGTTTRALMARLCAIQRQ